MTNFCGKLFCLVKEQIVINEEKKFNCKKKTQDVITTKNSFKKIVTKLKNSNWDHSKKFQLRQN